MSNLLGKQVNTNYMFSYNYGVVFTSPKKIGRIIQMKLKSRNFMWLIYFGCFCLNYSKFNAWHEY